MSELGELRKEIHTFREHGRHPTATVMTPQTWFRLKAEHVGDTGDSNVTFTDVIGTQVRFTSGGEKTSFRF